MVGDTNKRIVVMAGSSTPQQRIQHTIFFELVVNATWDSRAEATGCGVAREEFIIP
jgi:hypothetical protein